MPTYKYLPEDDTTEPRKFLNAQKYLASLLEHATATQEGIYEGVGAFWKHVLNNDIEINKAVPAVLREAQAVRDLRTIKRVSDSDEFHNGRWKENAIAMFVYVTGMEQPAEGQHSKQPFNDAVHDCIYTPQAYRDQFNNLHEGQKIDTKAFACANCIYDGNATRCQFYMNKNDNKDEDDKQKNQENQKENTKAKGMVNTPTPTGKRVMSKRGQDSSAKKAKSVRGPMMEDMQAEPNARPARHPADLVVPHHAPQQTAFPGDPPVSHQQLEMPFAHAPRVPPQTYTKPHPAPTPYNFGYRARVNARPSYVPPPVATPASGSAPYHSGMAAPGPNFEFSPPTTNQMRYPDPNMIDSYSYMQHMMSTAFNSGAMNPQNVYGGITNEGMDIDTTDMTQATGDMSLENQEHRAWVTGGQ